MYAKLIQRIEAAGGYVRIADGTIIVSKGPCYAQRTASGWTLYRAATTDRGRYFAESCTDEEAVRMITNGEVDHEAEALSSREVARRVLSDAIRDLVGPDSPQSEMLFEALDCLAS